jgi:hypothetical protein
MMTDILENVAQYVCMLSCMLSCMYVYLPNLYYSAALCSVCASSLCPTGTHPNRLHAFPVSDAELLSLFPECMTFYGIAAATYVFFLRLARCWPQLLVQWSSFEQEQRCYGAPHYLRCKIRCVTAALLFGAAGITSNHLLLVSQVVSFL